MDQMVTMTTLSAVLALSVALALLIEELVFGGLFRLFFGERPPLDAPVAIKKDVDLVNRARHSGL